MNSSGSVLILNIHISICFFTQKTHHCVIAVSSCEVKSREFIFGLHVDPALHFFYLAYAQILFIETISPGIFE